MKKIIFALIIFPLLFCDTAAQFLSEPVFNEVRLAKYNLLPEPFLLSLRDSVDISVIHPALLNKVNTNFSYLTYFGNEIPLHVYQSDYGEWETISSCSFFPALGQKWFLLIEHGTQNESDINNVYRSDGLHNFEDSQNYHAFNLKISNIGSLAGANSAVGIFFNFKNKEIERISNLTSGIDAEPHVVNQRSEFLSKDDFKKFQIGLEYSAFSDREIFTCQFAVQKCLPDIEINHSTRTFDSNAPDLYYVITRQNISLNYEPLTFSLKTKFNYKSDILFKNDNFFFNSFFHYSNDDASREFIDFSDALENSGYVTDEHDYKIYKTSKEKKWGLSATIGYSFVIKKSDISLLSGISGNFSRALLSNYSFDRFYVDDYYYLTYSDARFTSANVTIPFLINYFPTGNISFFGGVICKYDWIRNDLQNTSYGLMDNQQEIILDNDFDKTGQTSMIFRFGLDFTLAERIKSSIIFSDDFTDYKSWNVSLGYHF